MGHNLNTNKEKGTVSFAIANEPAWHSLGQVVDQAMTTAEAIELANLDFEVIKKPTFIQIGDVLTEVPESYATIRTDTNQILGSAVGEKYDILQNIEAFSFFDPILEKEEAFIETAGVLGDGERIFLTAKLPNHIGILGSDDPISQYLLITTSHDGKSATTVMFTPVRVVCQNTLNAALGGKTLNRLKIKHTTNQLSRLKLAHEILGVHNKYSTEISELFYKLANTKATEEVYRNIIVKGLADTPSMVKKYFNKKAKQSTRFTNNVEEVMKYAYEHVTQLMPSTKDTLFGAYNAITGFYQNEADWSNKDKGNVYDDDAKLRSIIDTNGRVNLKQQQAFNAALSYIKK